jgi:hypothetical protein
MSEWSLEKSQERDTLVTCPACKGSGSNVTERLDGTYTTRKCRWCDGLTGVTKRIVRLFQRWERILAVARLKGRCT